MRGTARPRGRRVGPAPLPPRLLKGGGRRRPPPSPCPALPCLARLCPALPCPAPPAAGGPPAPKAVGGRGSARRAWSEARVGGVPGEPERPQPRVSGWGARAATEERAGWGCAHERRRNGRGRCAAAAVEGALGARRGREGHEWHKRTRPRRWAWRGGTPGTWKHAPTAVEERAGWDRPQLWRSEQGGIAHSCGGVACTHSHGGLCWLGVPTASQEHGAANVAVEENAVWDQPPQWKSVRGACTRSCGGAYGVGAPTAVEEHRGWERPQPRRSAWNAYAQSCGGAPAAHAPVAVEERAGCAHPRSRRSTKGACAHSRVGAHTRSLMERSR